MRGAGIYRAVDKRHEQQNAYSYGDKSQRVHGISFRYSCRVCKRSKRLSDWARFAGFLGHAPRIGPIGPATDAKPSHPRAPIEVTQDLSLSPAG